jgi:hypothetical protein
MEMGDLLHFISRDTATLTQNHRLLVDMLCEGFSLKYISAELDLSVHVLKGMLREVETVLRRLSMLGQVSGRSVEIPTMKSLLDKLVKVYLRSSRRQGEFSLEKRDEVLFAHKFLGALLEEMGNSSVVVFEGNFDEGGVSRIVRKVARVKQ